MPLDGSALGTCASEQMEALERDYGDEEGVQVGMVMTIVEIVKEQGTGPSGNPRYISHVRMRHNVGDPYRVIGLMQQAMHNLLSSSGPSPEE